LSGEDLNVSENIFTHGAFGDAVNRVVCDARIALVAQNEIAHFAYTAFEHAIGSMPPNNQPLTFEYPIGWGPDDKAIPYQKTYSQQEIIARYRHLESLVLPNNVIGQLVTIVETMLHDAVRVVVARFPQRLDKKQKISTGLILGAGSIEEVHSILIESVLNNISYETPRDFADHFKVLAGGVNLLECAAFERYMELKATRDIYVHNRGFANETYERKAGSHARVRRGQLLPINMPYVFKANEHCVQLTEWLEDQFHERWHSLAYERRAAQKVNGRTQAIDSDSVSEQLRAVAAKVAQATASASISVSAKAIGHVSPPSGAR
jgi:hypothetical protein